MAGQGARWLGAFGGGSLTFSGLVLLATLLDNELLFVGAPPGFVAGAVIGYFVVRALP
jgi:hypothetical protein